MIRTDAKVSARWNSPEMSRDKLIHLVTMGVISVLSLLLSLAPLNAQTQATINATARSDFVKADADLNKTYRAVLAKLPDAEKQKLKETQRAWIASRDAEAAAAAKEASGSIGPTVRYGRMTDLTRKRITELKAMIDKESANESQTEAAQSGNNEATSISEAEPTPRSTPDSISPDKKWEYKPATNDRGPQIVKAGTDEATGDLLDDCDIGSCGDSANGQWAPDSKRFAFDWGQGRAHQSSFYQLRNDHWEPVKPAPGEEASERAQHDIQAQLKRKGLSTEKLEKKGLYLRYIWSEEKLDRWIDANTALLYTGLRKVIAKREDPGEMSDGFGADFLFTIKFDAAGNWKIVKTHSMSQKEVDERAKRE
jgi:uncharacterized protein YecT (DUF1311 family)